MLDFINCIGLGEKDPWHYSGQLVAAGERGTGVGVGSHSVLSHSLQPHGL